MINERRYKSRPPVSAGRLFAPIALATALDALEQDFRKGADHSRAYLRENNGVGECLTQEMFSLI